MDKELKTIRDNKLEEMINVLHDFDMRERAAIKTGKKTFVTVNGKDIAIYDDLIALTKEKDKYVKESLMYLWTNCHISKPEIIRRLSYLMKKNDSNAELWCRISNARVIIRNR